MLYRAISLASTKACISYVYLLWCVQYERNLLQACLCDIGSTAARIFAEHGQTNWLTDRLTEPRQHNCRLCSWQQPRRQNNILLCWTLLFWHYYCFIRVLFCMLFSVPAGNLEQSERDILTLRSQQGRFDERIVMMQHLLEVSSTFPWTPCASNNNNNDNEIACQLMMS